MPDLIYMVGQRVFPLQYLHKLFKRDHHKGQRFHERQIGLYAEYDRPNLLPFLRDSTHCPLEKVRPAPHPDLNLSVKHLSFCLSLMLSPCIQALEICQQRNFVEETVFLLSKYLEIKVFISNESN